MATKVNKSSTVVVAVPLVKNLELIAAQIAGAMQETASLSETLGALTVEAGRIIKKNPDQIDPFMDACRKLCESVGLSEGSFKVYMSNIRGVIRAMVGGYAPKAGASLRTMYNDAPKGTGRQSVKPGARHATDKAASAAESDDMDDEGDDSAAPAAPKVDAKAAAVTALFGHCDDELLAALAWAAKNEMLFLNYVKASVAAPKAAPVARKALKAA